MSDPRETLRALIDGCPDFEFSEFGKGIDERWISDREEALGLAFPPSYRWFLKSYHGGEICGDEIISVYEQPLSEFPGGNDIAHMHLLHQRHSQFPANWLIFMNCDGDEIFFFDTDQRDATGEFPVFRQLGQVEYYAGSFAEFLRKRIELFS